MVGLSGTLRIVGALLAAVPFAAPAPAETITAKVNAKVVKPLALKRVQDLDLGMVLLGPGTWAGAAVMLSRGGVLTCPANLTCSGVTQVAVYNVSGSNQATVRIDAPDVTLVNQTDPTRTLTMTVDSPGTVTLTNSGAKGLDFPLGGSIELDSATADGTYTGTFAVTVDY